MQKEYTYWNKKTGETIDTTMEAEELIDELPEDNKFAMSLRDNYLKFGKLTETQWYWVAKLALSKPELYPCDTADIFNRLQHGKLKIKYPSLNIDLTIAESGNVFSHGNFLCKYTDEGLVAGKSVDAEIINKFLLVFCKEGVDNCMKRIAKVTGICCYCGIVLTHDISIECGYGPVCAENHSLPFPFAEYRKSIS